MQPRWFTIQGLIVSLSLSLSTSVHQVTLTRSQYRRKQTHRFTIRRFKYGFPLLPHNNKFLNAFTMLRANEFPERVKKERMKPRWFTIQRLLLFLSTSVHQVTLTGFQCGKKVITDFTIRLSFCVTTANLKKEKIQPRWFTIQGLILSLYIRSPGYYNTFPVSEKKL